MPINRKAPFYLEVAKEKIEGHSSQFKFARSVAITDVESVVWDNGGDFPFLTAAETLDIVSDSADDASAGSGARTLLVYGLDSDYLEVSELVTLNGLTPVTTTQTFLRVYRALVVTSGTNSGLTGNNAGTITISGHTTTQVQAKILPNNGQTLMAVYTIPAGKTGYVTGVSFSAGQGKQCLFKAKFRNGPGSSYAFSVKYVIDLYENSFFGQLGVPLRVPEKTDIVITASTTSGTINAAASFGILLSTN